jgi:hypothetical protein
MLMMIDHKIGAPLRKSVVTEIKVTLADLRTRTLLCKGAGAIAMLDVQLQSTSFVLQQGTPHSIGIIKKILIIECSNPITLSFKDTQGVVILMLIVTNQFTLNGASNNVIELSALNQTSTNVQLVYG